MPEQKKNMPKSNDLEISRLFRILNRRKWILIIIVCVFVGLAFVYNKISKPIFESSVTLKKEKTEKSNATADDLTKIINQQTADEIETEVELVKTKETLTGTVEDLMLNAEVTKVEGSNGNLELNMPVLDFNKKYGGAGFPQFFSLKMNDPKAAYKIIIQKQDSDFVLLDGITKNQIATSKPAGGDTLLFSTSSFKMYFRWAKADARDRIDLNLNDVASTVKGLNSNVSVEQKPKTDVFVLSVKYFSPYSAKTIAEKLTEIYRTSRVDQQKQTIRYNFDFVDKNLEDIKAKLEEAESNLSAYKAAHGIMSVDVSSQTVTNFITNLEAEKLNNDLQLADYKNKYTQMGSELKKKGYFDQTFLAPQGNEPTNSPFSSSLKQLNDLELQRLTLLEKRKETHPDVIAVDKQINQVKKDLANSNDNTISSYSIMIKSLEDKASKINSMLGKYQGKLTSMPGQESNLAQLERQRAVYQKMYSLLLDKREEMRMAELSKLQDIIVVDAPRENYDPIAPRKSLNLAAAVILGLFFGFVGMFTAEMSSKRFVTLDEIENDFNLPIFAIIPTYTKELTKKIQDAIAPNEKIVTLMDNQDGYKESYRLLRTKLTSYLDTRSKILLFTSSEENTGKTSVVANLGAAFAIANKKVLVVDCDFRKGSLSDLFNIPDDAPGLVAYLKKKIPQPYIYNKTIPNLDILPSGGISESSSELLSSERMPQLIEILKKSSYDYIFIDTPPVTRVVDTLILGKYIKDVTLIVRPNHTFKDSINWGMDELNHEKMEIWGTVVNAAEVSKTAFKYRYGYGYGYHYKKVHLDEPKTGGLKIAASKVSIQS